MFEMDVASWANNKIETKEKEKKNGKK